MSLPIINALEQLRNDLKAWAIKNYKNIDENKLDKNFGKESEGQVLVVGKDGEVTAVEMSFYCGTAVDDLPERPEQ